MEAKNLSFDEIKVGDTVSFTRTLSEKDVNTFAELSGDLNPLHTDTAYAETTIFKQRIVHGMLTASLFSTLVGMYLPGKKCLYINQSLFFKHPVYIDDTVAVYGTVIAKSEVTKILTLSTVAKKGDVVVLEGEAKVQVL